MKIDTVFLINKWFRVNVLCIIQFFTIFGLTICIPSMSFELLLSTSFCLFCHTWLGFKRGGASITTMENHSDQDNYLGGKMDRLTVHDQIALCESFWWSQGYRHPNVGVLSGVFHSCLGWSSHWILPWQRHLWTTRRWGIRSNKLVSHLVEWATNGGRTVARTSARVTKEMGLKLDEKITPGAVLFANHAPWIASEKSLCCANPVRSFVSWNRNTLETSDWQCTTYLVMNSILI